MDETERRIESAAHKIEVVKHALSGELPNRSFFRQYEPQTEWFLRPRSVNGIHGIGHEARVMVWQEILSRLLIKNEASLDQEALRWASATHDTQRISDGVDWKHGERSAIWASENLALSQDTLDIVVYLNHWHVPSDEQAPQMTPELAVFKDSDALDRARLGDLNPRFLRHDESRNILIEPAEALFSLSTQLQWQEDMVPFESVMEAADQLGIIEGN